MGVNGTVSGGGGGITQTAAASRKHHGNAGGFDVTLPGVGCRQGDGGTFLQTFVVSHAIVEPLLGLAQESRNTGIAVNAILPNLASHRDPHAAIA